MTEIKELTKKKITELVEVAKELGIDSSGKKDELIQKIIDFHAGNNKENDSNQKVIQKKKIQEKKVTIKTTETDINSLILNLMESLNQRVFLISCKKGMVS